MNRVLHERARAARECALVRGWEYRQRNHAKGVWFRLRRELVDAAEAWAIPEAEADRLEAAGRVPRAVGLEIEPPKRLFFLTREEVRTVSGRHRVPLRLSGGLLGARSLALVPLEEGSGGEDEAPGGAT